MSAKPRIFVTAFAPAHDSEPTPDSLSVGVGTAVAEGLSRWGSGWDLVVSSRVDAPLDLQSALAQQTGSAEQVLILSGEFGHDPVWPTRAHLRDPISNETLDSWEFPGTSAIDMQASFEALSEWLAQRGRGTPTSAPTAMLPFSDRVEFEIAARSAALDWMAIFGDGALHLLHDDLMSITQCLERRLGDPYSSLRMRRSLMRLANAISSADAADGSSIDGVDLLTKALAHRLPSPALDALLELLDRACTSGHDPVAFLACRVELRLALGDGPAALAATHRLQQAVPVHGAYYRAVAFERLGDASSALQALEQALDHASAGARYSDIAISSSTPPAADDEAWIPLLLAHQGRILLSLGRFEDALDPLRNAIDELLEPEGAMEMLAQGYHAASAELAWSDHDRASSLAGAFLALVARLDAIRPRPDIAPIAIEVARYLGDTGAIGHWQSRLDES